MKRKLISILLCLTCLTGTISSQAAVATVPGSMTFDPSGWLSAIDQVYATYDMITNTITQIENQYKQIKMAIDRASSIDWTQINSNGDWDIRGEIRDATSKVDNLLSSTRHIKETLSHPFVNLNGFSYSIADICGAGSDGKTFVTAVKDMGYELENRFKDFCLGVVGQMTPKQRKAIYLKYGISPQNYVMVQQAVDQVHKLCAKAFGKSKEETQKLELEEQVAKNNKILNGAYSTVDENGNPTEAALSEATMLLMEQVVTGIKMAEKSINEVSEMLAAEMLANEKQEQAEREETVKQAQLDDRTDNRVPTRFKNNN